MGTGSTDLWTTDFQKSFMTEKMMHMMDTSGKGMVTKADYDKYMGKVFDMMDKNHKGMLDKNAFLAVEMGTGSTTIWTTDFQKTFRTAEMMHTMDTAKGWSARPISWPTWTRSSTRWTRTTTHAREERVHVQPGIPHQLIGAACGRCRYGSVRTVERQIGVFRRPCPP